MNARKGVLVRCTAMILLICAFAAAALYVEGAFELSFIDRQPPNENTKPPFTTESGPDVTGNPNPGTGNVGPSGTDTQNETVDPPYGSDTDNVGSDSETQLPPNQYSPPSLSDLLNNGYKLTYDDYTSGMVIAEVTLPKKFSELVTGSKYYRESVLAKIYSDETFTFGDMQMTKTDRYTVETYMGYILIAVENSIAVYDPFGNELFITEAELSPAYTRDKEDRPLFFTSANESKFFYIDFEEKKLVQAEDYNDEYDNRGLYFDYNPDYGKSDIGTVPVWQECEFYRYFSMNMSTSWHMNNVSPLIAKELQLMYPKYAAMVARYNIRFAHALVQAKIEIAEEEAARREEESKKAEEESKKAEEESKNAELSGESTEPVSPTDSSSETLISPPDETSTTESDNLTDVSSDITSPSADPAEITSPEDIRSPVEEVTETDELSSPAEDLTSPDVTTFPETSNDVNPSTDNSTETLTAPDETTLSPIDSVTESETVTETTEPSETTSKYPSDSTTGPIVIEKKFNLPRYGFMNNGRLLKGYSFARAFAFNNGRAAVIDDDGRLTFIGYSYNTVITKYSRFMSTIDGSDTVVYYISSYYAPVYNNMSSLGHFYFDNGYVTVRQVNIESMFNKRAGYDETYLIDTSGTRIYPPSGYNFVSCSEGIMIVERDGRYGYYDVANKMWIADPVYTYIMPFYEGIGVVGTDGAIGAIDINGNEVIPREFDYVSTMSTGLISAYSAEGGWRVFAKMTK